MSDINESGTNALSEVTASELGFDQFQYYCIADEDDCILLSDIVPPKRTVVMPQLPASYEDGLVGRNEMSSMEHLYEPQVKAGNGYETAERLPSDLSEQLTFGFYNHDSNARPDIVQTTVPETSPPMQDLPRKTGRKPKKIFVNSLLCNTSIGECPQTSLYQTDPETVTVGRRGRKPRNSEAVISHMDSEKTTNGSAIIGSDQYQEVNALYEKEAEIIHTAPKKHVKNKKTKIDALCSNSLTTKPMHANKESTLEITKGLNDTSPSKLLRIVTKEARNSVSKVGETQETSVSRNNVMDHFEYHIDKVMADTPNVVVETPNVVAVVAGIQSNFEQKIANTASEIPSHEVETLQDNNAFKVADSTKKPQCSSARKTMYYDVDSDAVPFADESSSKDDSYGLRRRKKNDDYERMTIVLKDSSDESVQDKWDEDNGWDDNFLSTKKIFDIDGLKPAVIKGNNCMVGHCKQKQTFTRKNRMEPANKEFRHFLTQRIQGSEGLKIKKVSKPKLATTTVVPLHIPTIEAKKSVHISTQTMMKETKSALTPTSSPSSTKITNNLKMSLQQSDNACKFLEIILKGTSDVGTLITKKSQEFINKKVKADFIKDTNKMDYCVKKASLLVKLAKGNLTTLEENLEIQYEDFLKANDLIKPIKTEKLASKPTETNNDSDCEIVGVTQLLAKPTNKINPKLKSKPVFLNKELCIKIAKRQ